MQLTLDEKGQFSTETIKSCGHSSTWTVWTLIDMDCGHSLTWTVWTLTDMDCGHSLTWTVDTHRHGQWTLTDMDSGHSPTWTVDTHRHRLWTLTDMDCGHSPTVLCFVRPMKEAASSQYTQPSWKSSGQACFFITQY